MPKTIIFKGLRINIENEAGSTRSGIDVDGKPWKQKMSIPYGEIIGSTGIDGDPVDVFIGPDKAAKFVYIITTTHKERGHFDENKCMLGFPDAMSAKAAFYRNYTQPELHYGDMSVLSLEEFKKKVLQTKKNPTLIRASKMNTAISLYAQDNNNPFKIGDPVVVDGFHGRGVVLKVDGRRVTIRFRNREYVSRDQIYVHSMTENDYKSKYSSLHANEGIPEEEGRKGKYIEKVGTQFCIRSDGIDQNFGCWPSMEKAEAVMAGKSFIEPDVNKSLLASKTKKKDKKKPKIPKTSQPKAKGSKSPEADQHPEFFSPVTELRNKITMYVDQDTGRLKMADVKASAKKCPNCGSKKFGLMPADFETAKCNKCGKTWNYGIKAGGLGSGRHPDSSRSEAWNTKIHDPREYTPAWDKIDPRLRTRESAYNKVPVSVALDRAKQEREKIILEAVGPKIKFKNPSPYRTPGTGKTASVGVASLKNPIKLGKPDRNPGVIGKIRADFGEPNAGAYQHAHLDSNLFFHPPSARNPQRVPADDPGETNNKFGDVDKRKNANKQRMDILKRSAPGGSPPNVPVRTTLISPTLNSYMPLHASRVRRRHGGGRFRAYGAAKI